MKRRVAGHRAGFVKASKAVGLTKGPATYARGRYVRAVWSVV